MLIQSDERPIDLRRQVPKHYLIRRMDSQCGRNEVELRWRVGEFNSRKISMPAKGVSAAGLRVIAL